jgi:hypothetical protein
MKFNKTEIRIFKNMRALSSVYPKYISLTQLFRKSEVSTLYKNEFKTFVNENIELIESVKEGNQLYYRIYPLKICNLTVGDIIKWEKTGNRIFDNNIQSVFDKMEFRRFKI